MPLVKVLSQNLMKSIIKEKFKPATRRKNLRRRENKLGWLARW